MTKFIVYILTFFLVSLLCIIILVLSVEDPPQDEINRAQKRLVEAEKIKSSKYAPELFHSASAYYDSSLNAWRHENERLFLFRNFKKAKEFAALSNLLAEEAITVTRNKISVTEELLGLRISMLENRFHDLIEKYGNIPINNAGRNDLVKGKLLLSEGILAYNQENFLASKIKLDSTELIISLLDEYYVKILGDYFSQYPQWHHWVTQSISNSKRNKTDCIIIDKYARECMLYDNGRMVQKFTIELSVNWIGDKNEQGDKSTPEGLYVIKNKKSGKDTKYYKALLLNYPNEEDKKRFVLNKKKKIIEQDAKIGSLIEIHGNGGKGIDWTDGCIALKDSDIDILFEVCNIGTRVTIVGSLKPLKELFP